MSKYCMICRNTACQNHGKNITFFGDSWQCDYTPTPTNADRIRAMSDEELAKWLEYEGGGACAEVCGWLNWLQLPAEEDARWT